MHGPVNIHISVVCYNQSFVGLCAHSIPQYVCFPVISCDHPSIYTRFCVSILRVSDLSFVRIMFKVVKSNQRFYKTC